MTKSRGINRPMHRWTKREAAMLRRRYPHERTLEIAKDLNQPLQNVYAKASNMGLNKSREFLANDKSGRIFKGGKLGQGTQFKPGHASHNKGKKGWCPKGCEKSWFKKGTRPHTWLPVGTEKENADGYLVRKLSDTGNQIRDWKPVHRLLWEATNGPIPPKHLVVFKDADRKHVVIENLELITRAENARRNVMWRKYPKELAHVLQLRGAINRQINRRLGAVQEKNRDRRKIERRAIRNARRASGQGKPDGHRAREGGRPGG